MTRKILATLALSGALLLSAAPALADQTITAGPAPLAYANTEITMAQGEAVLFQNSDSSGASHDVRAETNGADGKPLFKSEIIPPSKTSPVAGVEYLTTGDYAFRCTLHDFMKGTIHVSSDGTPKPRPAPDTTPPDVTIGVLDTKIGAVLKRGSLRVRLGSDEPTRFKLTAKASRKTIASGILTLSKGTSRTGTIRLTAAGKRLLKSAKKVAVKLAAVANDAADNKAGATAGRTLKR